MSSGGMNHREITRLAATVERAGWRVRQQDRVNHWLAYPPQGGRPVGFSVSTDQRARANVYAAFRRCGLELDPARLARAS